MLKSLKNFPVQSQVEWVEQFYREGGNEASPERSWEGLTLSKFYAFDSQSTTLADSMTGYLDYGADDPAPWHNIVSIHEEKAKNANSEALNDLMLGADGLQFHSIPAEDLEEVLQDILPDFASLCFEKLSWEAQSAYREWLDDHDIDRDNVRGYITSDNPGGEKDSCRLFREYPQLKTLCLTQEVPGEGQWVDQLVRFLQETDQLFEDLSARGMAPEEVWNRIVLIVRVGPLFFEEIARLKVLRLLTYKIARAWGAVNIRPGTLLLHSISEVYDRPNYDPHGNMLKSVTATLAAILAGAGMITTLPASPGEPLDRRIARNVNLILREESFLNQVRDPLGGAYYVNGLVTGLGKKAWENFTSAKPDAV